MPETDALADSLTMPDSLNFGQYDTDVLAGASVDAYIFASLVECYAKKQIKRAQDEIREHGNPFQLLW